MSDVVVYHKYVILWYVVALWISFGLTQICWLLAPIFNFFCIFRLIACGICIFMFDGCYCYLHDKVWPQSTNLNTIELHIIHCVVFLHGCCMNSLTFVTLGCALKAVPSIQIQQTFAKLLKFGLKPRRNQKNSNIDISKC